MKDKAQGMLVGLAVGDAVGTTVEFETRGTFPLVTDMLGGGPFNLKKGQWTDDTSMALCLATSLIKKNGFDAIDQMNRYCNWANWGYLSSTGECFDIGFTVQSALQKYSITGNPLAGSTEKRSAGNGSIMRLAPVVLAYYKNTKDLLFYAGESSKTTHGCDECIESCRLLALILKKALTGESKEETLKNHDFKTSAPKVSNIAKGNYLTNSYESLTGSGYVIESLESALWCFYHTDNYKAAILMATNIGNDADTTAAICGQVAGAFYGYSAIPREWREAISMHDDIVEIAATLLNIKNTRYNKEKLE